MYFAAFEMNEQLLLLIDLIVFNQLLKRIFSDFQYKNDEIKRKLYNWHVTMMILIRDPIAFFNFDPFSLVLPE